MSKQPKGRRAIALLLLFALALFAYPASAQGPERGNFTVVEGGISLESSFSLDTDKAGGVQPSSESEEAPAPLLEGPAAGQSQDAPQNAPAFTTGVAGNQLVSVIVELQDDSLVAYDGGVAGLAPTSPAATGAKRLNVASGESQAYLNYLITQQNTFAAEVDKTSPGATITHRYQAAFNGVSIVLPADQVDEVSKLAGVKGIYADQLLQPDTDTSPNFIGANRIWKDLGGQAKAGEGVVVGVLDTGIWPEHPSFSDPDPSGKTYPVPPNGTGGYGCNFGGGANPGLPFTCNNKLIGAYRFMATYDAVVGLLPAEFTSPRDDNGHGTHTGSTAAGNAKVNATIFGRPFGQISGIAPRAHVIAYKVCGDQGCFQSDSAAAVNQAILDGVDVINFSISGGNSPFSDAVELAFLNAYNAGVFVAASAGNTGPGADTTNHRGPWVMTVGASTTDRAFKNTLTLFGGGGSTLQLTGTSLTSGVGPAPVVVNADPLCQTPAAPGTFTGQIVVCQRGGNGRVNKGFNVFQGGAVGMILYNQATNVTDLETDNHYLPTTHIQFSEGQQVLAFLAANPGATGTLTAGVKSTQQGDVMASFSSRGGPGQPLGVSKPDVTAPGVQILAGHTPQSADPDTGPQGQLFQAIAGTSMSSPHVAGAAALLKDLHPDWTPGQIKSALMTTAKTSGVVKEDGVTQATPFDFGSGRIDLRKAGDPGITFDETGANYVALQSQLWNANYPSVYIPAMPGKITVSRAAKDVLGRATTWTLTTATDRRDWSISVPATIHINANGTATFDITIDARNVPIGEVRHGEVRLTDGFGKLHIPVSFVRRQPVVTLTKTCDSNSIKLGKTMGCTITAANNGLENANVNLTDIMPIGLALVPGSVTNATEIQHGLTFNGVIAGATPPDVSLAPGSSIAGYLPLSLFGIGPIAGVGDDTITNFNVPAFTYGGETYTSLGISSNGYLVVGGGSGPDNSLNNQNFPNPARPNNVLAAFWTDLNPAAAGAIRIGTLTDGLDTWIVVDWNGVREFSTAGNLHSFEIWIGINSDANPGEDISFAYGPNTGNGDLGFASVGVENRFGNRGNNTYFDGVGTLPANGTELRVTSTPPTPSETRVITFQVKGETLTKWQNCAELTSNLFQGTNLACFSGTTVR